MTAPATTPRIAPGDRGDVGAFAWGFAALAGRVSGTGPPNLFLTLGRHRRLFRGWLRFAGRLMPRGTLPRRDTELVILRVAHVRSCDYERTHHERLGRKAGLSAAELARVADGPDAPGWSPREQAVLRATNALLRDHDIDDETWRALHGHLGDQGCIELCLLVGHYDMLAGTINALRIQPDTH